MEGTAAASRAVTETFSKPMFSVDSLEAQFRSALDVAAAEFATQKQHKGALSVGGENVPIGLTASQESALAHSVTTLTMSAVKSALLPDAQGYARVHDDRHSGTFRNSDCIPVAFPFAFKTLESEQTLGSTSSLDHSLHCDVHGMPFFIECGNGIRNCQPTQSAGNEMAKLVP